MFDLQEFLFSRTPARRELIDYKAKAKKEYKVCVYRNHSFELVENTIAAYLDFANLGAEFVYSDYDDSLSFINLDTSADILILWIDMGRYASPEPEKIINARLSVLLDIFKKPILFAPLEGNANPINDKITIYDFDSVKNELGDKFLDVRMESVSGTRLSAAACMAVSRDLGTKYIPALLRTELKAVIVDLDNTLYQGILGEDGITGIKLTAGHEKLQKKIKELAEQGYFICIASKNDERDVVEMFNQRKDFPLKMSDFSVIFASWDNKSDSISKIAAYLNIGIDSMVFIDDNIVELAAVKEVHPLIHEIHANENADITYKVLDHYPGLMKLKHSKEDDIRKNDVKANEERMRRQSTLSKEEYMKSLGMELLFEIDNPDNAFRVSELSNKTNQFIFNYKRYHLPEVEALISAKDSAVITISLKDNLTDSGIIGVCTLKKCFDYIEVEEVFVSCRALGRGIDEIVVLGAINTGIEYLGCNRIKVNFTKGERNFPAEKFIETSLAAYTNLPEVFSYDIPETLVKVTIRKG